MRNLLKDFLELYRTNEEFQSRVSNYVRYLQTDDGKFIRDVVLTIKGNMLDEIFSKKFTELDKEIKDVQQRTYYQVHEILDFVINPMGWFKKQSRFKIPKIGRTD